MIDLWQNALLLIWKQKFLIEIFCFCFCFDIVDSVASFSHLVAEKHPASIYPRNDSEKIRRKIVVSLPRGGSEHRKNFRPLLIFF
jgi:hypothetical protein